MLKKKQYRLFWFIVLAIFLGGCKSQKKYPTTCKEVFDSYSSYLKNEMDSVEMSLLVNSLKQISNQESNCIYSSLLISDIYLSVNEYTKAKGWLLKAVEIDETNVYALFKLGTIFNLEGQFDSAIVYFRGAAQAKSPGRVVVDKTKGFSEITETPYLDVDYSEIIFNNAIASYRGNYMVDAMNEFNYCISNERRLKESYFFRGLLYVKIEYYEKACSDFIKAKEYGNSEAEDSLKKYCN